tara:strand:+ start:219 stop:401 length:183 start_codon:yes stop_codon:yes gene_type:complete
MQESDVKKKKRMIADSSGILEGTLIRDRIIPTSYPLYIFPAQIKLIFLLGMDILYYSVRL